MEKYMNLNEIAKTDSRIELFHTVSSIIKEKNLPYVNSTSKSVIPKKTIYTVFVKRLLDIVISIFALVITFPINIILAIITFFDVGKPIFFKQKRPGKDGKPFIIIKFRNMTNETDANGDLLPSSQRVTKIGYWIRKASLDELLNFWCILKGDMSIIGPRPLEEVYLERFSDRHKMRMAVRPGLECPYLHTIDHKVTWLEQFENDIFYVENCCFSLDCKMLFALVKMVFNSTNNSMRGASVRGGFLGYEKNGDTINALNVPSQYVEEALSIMKKRGSGLK